MTIGRRKIFFEPAAGYFSECVWRPAVDVRRTGYGWLIKVELPGVPPDQVALSFEGNTLVLSGSRRDTLLEEGDSYYAMEISYSRFERRIELPGEIAGADVRRSSQEGLLILRLGLRSSGAADDALPQVRSR